MTSKTFGRIAALALSVTIAGVAWADDATPAPSAPATRPANRRPTRAYAGSAAPRSGEGTGARGEGPAPVVFAPLASKDAGAEIKVGYASLLPAPPALYFWLPNGSGKEPVRVTLSKRSATDAVYDVRLRPLPAGLHRAAFDVGLGALQLEPNAYYKFTVTVGSGDDARFGTAWVIFRDKPVAEGSATTDRWFDTVDDAASAYQADATPATLAALRAVLGAENATFDPKVSGAAKRRHPEGALATEGSGTDRASRRSDDARSFGRRGSLRMTALRSTFQIETFDLSDRNVPPQRNCERSQRWLTSAASCAKGCGRRCSESSTLVNSCCASRRRSAWPS